MDLPAQTDIQATSGAEQSNILLLNIPTASDNEEAEDGSPASWTKSPFLRRQILQNATLSSAVPRVPQDYFFRECPRRSSSQFDSNEPTPSPDPDELLFYEHTAIQAARQSGAAEEVYDVIHFFLELDSIAGRSRWNKYTDGTYLSRIRGEF
jgi:hypothetical protein